LRGSLRILNRQSRSRPSGPRLAGGRRRRRSGPSPGAAFPAGRRAPSSNFDAKAVGHGATALCRGEGRKGGKKKEESARCVDEIGRRQRTTDWRRHGSVRREDQVMMNSRGPQLIRADRQCMQYRENLQSSFSYQYFCMQYFRIK